MRSVSLFESSVISYGSQTSPWYNEKQQAFESSVISYGSQTSPWYNEKQQAFESSVISYGSQTLFVFFYIQK